MVAMILPFSVMEFAEANPPNMTKKIQKPVQSELQKETKIKVKALVLERLALMAEGQPLKEKYQENGLQSLTDIEKNRLEQIHERLNEITTESKNINTESRKQYVSTPEQKRNLNAGHRLVTDSSIPFTGLGIDFRVKALNIMFPTQEIADQYIPQLDEILNVSYYIEIGKWVDYNCAEQNSHCDPLIGGIEIDAEYSNKNGGVETEEWGPCSISVPIIRNVMWWTEEGFVTAAHCFAYVTNISNNGLGNHVKQPVENGSIVGEVTAIQNSGECDCAFVATNGERDSFFGYWSGYQQTNELISKSDPTQGDYVVMIGKTSGIRIGEVIATNETANGIENLHVIGSSMAGGDSGGIVIDFATFSSYQGLVKGGEPFGNTVIVPWSHIDNALNLQ